MPVSTSTAVIFDSAAQRRALTLGFAASVIVHAALLAASPQFHALARAGSPGILVATLAPGATPPGQDAAVTQTEPMRPGRVRGAAQSRQQPAPDALKPPARPSPPARAATRPSEPDSDSGPRAADSPDTDATAAGSRARPLAAAGAGNSAVAVDSGLLERYRLALRDAIERYYPPEAVERGWQGRVEIRLVIGTGGTIKSASIKTPSSHRVLDDQALEMVQRGARFARVPPLLRGLEFTVDVPVVFELRDG